MRLRELSIRAKVLVTGLGALLIALGVGALLSFRYWEQEQFAVAAEHAVMAVRAIRPSIEGALAHGQVGLAREQLDSLVARPPAHGYRIVAYDGLVLLASDPEEEGVIRPGPPLPDTWDIPSDGLALFGRGEPTASAVVVLSNIGGPGGRAALELVLDVRGIDDAISRGRRYGLALTVLLAVAYAVVLGLMLEREVVAPLGQLRARLAKAQAGDAGVRVGRVRGDEFGSIGESVDRLLDKEERLARLAELRAKALAEQAGFAELGALAADVGHEIKRPLAGIHSALELIEHEYAMSDAARQLLGRIEGQLDQVDRTVGDLLGLAKPVGLDARKAKVSEVADAALVRMVGTPGFDRVETVRDYDAAEPLAAVDAPRLEQALVNLLSNAVEAMPGGGTLSVATRVGDGELIIEVADTGVGIPSENVDLILKPFFSTKPQGTGLGLSLVARVIAAHGGRLGVSSEVGKGTVFRIHLPVGGAAAAKAGAP